MPHNHCMRRTLCYRLPVLWFAAMTAGAQQPPAAAPPTDNPEVVVTGKAPHDPSLPALKPDEFTHCMAQIGPTALERGNLMEFAMQSSICEQQLGWEKHVVIEACINRDGKAPPARVIQACSESLDHKILQGDMRFYIYVNRAAGYLAAGDREHALADYNEAVSLAPKNADLYYNRGVFYATQPDDAAALRDFDAALAIDAKLVPALRQRAKIHQSHNDFSAALTDYSEAIRLQPKTAALWSERGYVSLRQHDYQSAIQDEAEAIRLDPRLARAYFYRAAAFGGVGDRKNAVDDVTAAVRLDPELDRYVMSKGKTAYLALPPL